MTKSGARGHAASLLALLALAVAGTAEAGVPTPPVTVRQVEDTLGGEPKELMLANRHMYFVAAPQADAAAGGPAFRVASVAFSGNSLVPSDALQAQVATLVGTQATYADLVAAAQKLTRFYQSRGYPFATVVAPQQKGDGGVARFEVGEGRLGKIRVEGNSSYTREAVLYSLSGLEAGKPVTRAALESAMSALNALPGMRATAQPAAGAPGEMDLLVKVEDLAFGFRATIDNHGREDVGLRRFEFVGHVNSLSGWGDQLTFGAIGGENGGMQHFTLGYSVPVDASGNRVEVSYAQTEFDVGIPALAAFDFAGQSSVIRLAYAMPLARGAGESRTLEIGLERIESEMTSNATQISSNDLGLLTFGLRSQGISGDSTRWMREYSFATNFRDNPDGLEDDAVLGAFRADMMMNSPLNGDAVRFEGRLSLAYSLDPAIDWTRFTAGGPNSVRAYQSSEVIADGGIFASAEFQRWVGSGAFRAAFVAFGEMAYLSSADSPAVTQTDGPYLGGVGVGIRFGGRNFYGAFEYGVPVGNRDSTDGDRDRVWLSISAAL